MPKVAKELSPLAVRRLSRPGLHAVGGVAGLLLRISDTGARYWVLRTSVGGRRRDIGVGPYPEVSLARARELSGEIRTQARLGVDPVAERAAARDALRAARAKALTFEDCAERYITGKASEFRSAKHLRQWRSTVDQYARPVLGDLPVDHIELAHVLQVLEPIWREKTETANRLRGRIEKVLDFATVSGFRSGENPARWKGNLDAILPAPGKIRRVTHHRALPWHEVPGFVARLRAHTGIAARALEFLILTAARSGEVRSATWEEFDFNAGTWTIPPERMKNQRAHLVPLPTDALTVVESMPRHEGTPYIFTAVRGEPLSDVALSALIKRMKVQATPHGFRSSFRDWTAETTSFPPEVAEMALAHTISSEVERAYRRGDLREKRRRLMGAWAKFINEGPPAADIRPIREAVQ